MPNEFDSIDLQVLNDILVNLVTVPEEVKIERKLDEQGVLLSVIVNSKDMGIVIGRNGSMATAVKTVMRAIGKAKKMNIRLQFLEPDGSVRYSDRAQKSFEDRGNNDQDSFVGSDAFTNTENSAPLPKSAPLSSGDVIEEDLSDFVIN